MAIHLLETQALLASQKCLYTGITVSGLEKSAVPLPRTSRFSFWASNFTLALAQWARDQASHPSTKSLKGQTKTCHGQANFKRYLSQEQVGIQVFSSPVSAAQQSW